VDSSAKAVLSPVTQLAPFPLPHHGRSQLYSFQDKVPNMPTGKVKWFNGQKGFGFIQPDDGSKDVFVHISAVERAGLGSLNEGQKLSYDLQQERGKTSAANLKAL
jgi:CspA family cold shock protein